MPRHTPAKVRLLLPLLALLTLGRASAATPATLPAPTPANTFGVLYTAWIKAGNPQATVRIRLSRNPQFVRAIRLNIDPASYQGFKGTGSIKVSATQVLWTPPREDAWIQYTALLDRKRASGRNDALMTDSWALFRGDDLVPTLRIDAEDNTQSVAKLRLNLPDGWSAETRFPRYTSGRYRIDNPHRFFDRPSGWMLVGKIGTRRDTIGHTRVAVAAPLDQGVRRMDMLALFRFTLPSLQTLFPDFPGRLLIVSAGDPMWRGALSGPSSLFVHADRPLISENATSTVLHELVHVAMRARGTPGADWIVEGMAEYYSLEVLKRSGAISAERYQAALQSLATWGQQAPRLDTPESKGPVTARAVGTLHAIDAEIRRVSGGKASLDEVARIMAGDDVPVTLAYFRGVAERVAGRRLTTIPG